MSKLYLEQLRKWNMGKKSVICWCKKLL